MASHNASVRRMGKVIELRRECLAEYQRVHADSHPGVRDLLVAANLRNFSIFLHEVAGKLLLFLYAEYVGSDFEGDMAKLDAEPRNAAWLAQCDPMQQTLKIDGTSWSDMECVYYNT